MTDLKNAKRTYAITCATGRTGGIVSRGLLAAGHAVRVIGRDEDRLRPLVEAGGEPFVGTLEDEAFVARCFDGADAAYLLNPASYDTRDFRRAFADLGALFGRVAADRGVGHVVFLSAIGSHDERYRGFLTTHGDVEIALNANARLNVLSIRSVFVNNLLYFLPASQAMDALASPIDPDAPLDLVHVQDIAGLALDRLLALDFSGKTSLELRGHEVLTMRAIAARISTRIGRPLPVARIDRDADIDALIGHGVPADFSNLINDTWETFSRHGLLRAPDPQPFVTASTPIDKFLEEAWIPAFLDAGDPS